MFWYKLKPNERFSRATCSAAIGNSIKVYAPDKQSITQNFQLWAARLIIQNAADGIQ